MCNFARVNIKHARFLRSTLKIKTAILTEKYNVKSQLDLIKLMKYDSSGLIEVFPSV